MKVVYPTTATSGRAGWRIAFPDVPEATAEGRSRAAAIAAASAGLVVALRHRLEEHGELPRPSPVRVRREAVSPPLLAAAKLLLLQAMHQQEVTNVALARRLGIVEGSVRRMSDLGHRSHVAAVEAALAALGQRLVVEAWPANTDASRIAGAGP